MKRRYLLKVLAVSASGLILSIPPARALSQTMVHLLSIEEGGELLQVIFTADTAIQYKHLVLDEPDRVVVDLNNTRVSFPPSLALFTNEMIQRIRLGEPFPNCNRIVFETRPSVKLVGIQHQGFDGGEYRLSINFSLQGRLQKQATAESQPKPAVAQKEIQEKREIPPDPTSERAVVLLSSIEDDGKLTRIIFSGNQAIVHRELYMDNPDRMVIDFFQADLETTSKLQGFNNNLVKKLRLGNPFPYRARIVMDLKTRAEVKTAFLPSTTGNNRQLSVEIRRPGPPAQPVVRATKNPEPSRQQVVQEIKKPEPSVQQITEEMKKPEPSVRQIADERQEAIRYALRPNDKIVIVIDPGHGGIDPGTTGKAGTREKHITLTIAEKLADKLRRVNGCTVCLTRETDIFLPLTQRIAIAEENNADLFLSLHADAYHNPAICGASVFCLPDHCTIPMEVAARRLIKQNKSDRPAEPEDLGNSAESLIKYVQSDFLRRTTVTGGLALGQKLIDSLKTAKSVRVQNTQVKRAEFLVLKTPGTPSALLEMAFLSNPRDEQHIRSTSYQDILTDAIRSGVCDFLHLPIT